MAVVNSRPTPAVGACLTLRPTTFITWHKTGTMLTEMLRKILLEHVNASCAGGTLHGHLIATTGFHPKAIHNGTRDTIDGSYIDGKDRMAFHFLLGAGPMAVRSPSRTKKWSRSTRAPLSTCCESPLPWW